MPTKEDRKYITRYKQRDIEMVLGQKHGPRFQEYRRQWAHSSAHCEAPEKPLALYMETNAHCNLKCKMCPHSHFGDKEAYLPMPLIEKAAAECAGLGIPSVLVGASTECLIHPNIKSILRLFKYRHMQDFFVITNGLKLTEDIARHLIDLQIERLNVSLDAATPETYRTIRGGKLELVEKNIHRFLELRDKAGSDLPYLRISFVVQEDNLHERDAFYEKWKDVADLIDFQDMVDFTPLMQLRQIEVPSFTCPDPFQKLAISWDGTIYPCCSFYQRYFPLGNIATMSLQEAWQSDTIRALRESFHTGNNHMACRNCLGITLQRKQELG